MSRAVAGHTTHEVGALAEPGVRDRVGARPTARCCTGSDASAEKVGVADEARARPAVSTGHHVRAGVDQPAAHLDRLVGGDAAGDAEDDACGRRACVPAAGRLGRLAGSSDVGRRASSTSAAIGRTILSAAISSKAIDSGLRATEVTCGGTMAPRPSPSWPK